MNFGCAGAIGASLLFAEAAIRYFDLQPSVDGLFLQIFASGEFGLAAVFGEKWVAIRLRYQLCVEIYIIYQCDVIHIWLLLLISCIFM